MGDEIFRRVLILAFVRRFFSDFTSIRFESGGRENFEIAALKANGLIRYASTSRFEYHSVSSKITMVRDYNSSMENNLQRGNRIV